MKRPLLPRQQNILNTVGENIRYARLRRDLSLQQVAERAGIGRNTLIKIEKGDEGVAIGSYFRVLVILHLENDFLNLAKDDILGRKLQDAKLTIKKAGFERPQNVSVK